MRLYVASYIAEIFVYCGNLCTNKMLCIWGHYKIFRIFLHIQVVISIAPTYSTLLYEHVLPLGLLARDFKTQSKQIFVFSLEKSISSNTYTITTQNIHITIIKVYLNGWCQRLQLPTCHCLARNKLNLWLYYTQAGFLTFLIIESAIGG